MFAENDRISKRQTTRLLIFDLLGYSAISLPGMLAKVAGRDGVFSMILGILFGFFYLLLLNQVIKKTDTTYEALLINGFGKVLGTIFLVFYALFFLLLAGKVAASFTELVVTELLEQKFHLILFLILFLAFYGVCGGIECRARVYEILFWILLVPLGLLFLCAIPSVQVDYWTPVFSSSVSGVLEGGYDVFLSFFALAFLPFLAEFVVKKDHVYQSGRAALFLVGGIILVLYLILLGMFGAKALLTVKYPAVTMMSLVQMTGGFLKRTDTILFGIWFFTLFALLSSLIFFGGRIMSGLIMKKKGSLWGMLASTVFVYGMAELFYRREELLDFFELAFRYVGMPLVVLIPIFCIWKKCGKLLPLFLCCIFLSGCTGTEVEDREFPVTLTVNDKTNQFAKEWLNTLVEGTKKVDYNHLKVIVIERDYLEDDAKMSELLALLKQEKSVPLNAYVVTTDDAKSLKECEETIGMPLGNYVEELLEKSEEIKKETYPTIGLLYQEKENRMETLFIPYLTLVDEKPVIVAYEAYKRGEAKGLFETDIARLSFFLANQTKKQELQLAVNQFVELSNTKNKLSFAETREKTGRLRKQVIVEVNCDGKILYQTMGEDKEEIRTFLSEQIAEYMEGKTKAALLRGIDITNSKKKLGGNMREWYEYYEINDKAYEEEIDVCYRIKINWMD